MAENLVRVTGFQATRQPDPPRRRHEVAVQLQRRKEDRDDPSDRERMEPDQQLPVPVRERDHGREGRNG
jgi:hypothetical protein